MNIFNFELETFPGNVAADLYKSIQSKSARQAELDFRKTIDSLIAEDIADAVAYAIIF